VDGVADVPGLSAPTTHDESPPADEGAGEDHYYVLGVGGFGGVVLRFLNRFRRPVVALRGRSLWRVMVRGGGFELPVEPTAEGGRENPTGFYTLRYVAASTRLEAEALAKANVLREWQGLSLMGHFTGVDEPVLQAEESVEVEGWFWRNGGKGFTFFRQDDEEASH
jgi:hypothetical protein